MSQCFAMQPFHGFPAQTRPSPYQIRVSQPFYTPGRSIRVSIQSFRDDIKGYLIEARRIGLNSPVGTFVSRPRNSKYLSCGHRQVKMATACLSFNLY